MSIRGAPRTELRSAVMAALDPAQLSLAEETEAVCYALVGQPGRVWRRRLQAAMDTWGQTYGYVVGDWNRPVGPWEMVRPIQELIAVVDRPVGPWEMFDLYQCRNELCVQPLTPRRVILMARDNRQRQLKMAIDVPQEINVAIWADELVTT